VYWSTPAGEFFSASHAIIASGTPFRELLVQTADVFFLVRWDRLSGIFRMQLLSAVSVARYIAPGIASEATETNKNGGDVLAVLLGLAARPQFGRHDKLFEQSV
jgi:hypothetical protein